MSDGSLDFEAAELEDFIEEYMAVDRGVRRPKGIYTIIPGSREKKYQYTLKYFLDPQKPHGFGYAILETFFDCIGFHEFNLTGQHIEIEDEVWIADDDKEGRIDLVICGGNALVDHPRWAVFLELKVGADEGEGQLEKYDDTEGWNFNWFDSGVVTVDDLDDTMYIYVKREVADDPIENTSFNPVDWTHIVETLETGIRDSIFDHPHRSVIQFTDFIQSLKETEGMDPAINEDEINERLHVYFEHRDLIQQIEKANSQFESDFEDLSTYLQDNWENKVINIYDFEGSDWKTSPSSNPKYQGILPAYWDQDPLNQQSTIKLYFRHSPTTDSLRNQTLTFRLRLPSARNVHTEKHHGDQSFNDVFAEICTAEYADKIDQALKVMDVDDSRLGSAGALVEKNYQLDPHNLASSYFKQLDNAIHEFCSNENQFLVIINEIFEESYRTVFGKEPVGEFPGHLQKQR